MGVPGARERLAGFVDLARSHATTRGSSWSVKVSGIPPVYFVRDVPGLYHRVGTYPPPPVFHKC